MHSTQNKIFIPTFGPGDFTKMAGGHDQAYLTLGDLPESCLSRILALTTPKDVCVLSVLSHAFNSAGSSDLVWEKMLPPHYRQLLGRACMPLEFNSKKELYLSLCKPVFIDKGIKKFWLDQSTGKLCFMLSARDVTIIWGDDNQYWRWVSQDDPSFEEIAGLIAVCWFDVQGQFDGKLLSPGIAYTVSFKLKLHGSARNRWPNPGRIFHFFHMNNRSPYGWDGKAVNFSIATSCGHHKKSAWFLQDTESPVDNEGHQMTSLRHVEEGWMEFDAGEFVVDENEDGPQEVKFSMTEWGGGNWMGGFLVEGVKIQPSFLLTKRNNVEQK